MNPLVVEKLKKYFESRDEIVMAFLFGSFAKETMTDESDVDIAVYFKSEGTRIEWEANKEFAKRSEIWGAVEKIVGINTDFVVLNNAPASVAASALFGIPLVIKNKSLYWRFYLIVTSVAEDFRAFVEDYWRIKERSRSLADEDRERLIHTADFLKDELSDFENFKGLSEQTYQTQASQRREVERWVENIVNASIDIAKILLASEKQKIPRTYKEVLLNLALLPKFDLRVATQLAEFAELRNFLAHEYLDLRFKEITDFLGKADDIYHYLYNYVHTLLQSLER